MTAGPFRRMRGAAALGAVAAVAGCAQAGSRAAPPRSPRRPPRPTLRRSSPLLPAPGLSRVEQWHLSRVDRPCLAAPPYRAR